MSRKYQIRFFVLQNLCAYSRATHSKEALWVKNCVQLKSLQITESKEREIQKLK